MQTAPAVPTMVLYSLCIIHNSNFTCRMGVGLTSTLPQILVKLIGPDFGGPLQTSLHYTANYRHCVRQRREICALEGENPPCKNYRFNYKKHIEASLKIVNLTNHSRGGLIYFFHSARVIYALIENP